VRGTNSLWIGDRNHLCQNFKSITLTSSLRISLLVSDMQRNVKFKAQNLKTQNGLQQIKKIDS